MTAQLQLIAEREAQRRERDAALDRIEATRAQLISIADKLARELVRKSGRVTSSDVFREMKALGYGPLLASYDPRWMGAVFRKGKGWQRVGWVNDGSHSRPVAVWAEAAG